MRTNGRENLEDEKSQNRHFMIGPLACPALSDLSTYDFTTTQVLSSKMLYPQPLFPLSIADDDRTFNIYRSAQTH